jgi:predicted Fe-S protein YdhL (DUF1289 family)
LARTRLSFVGENNPFYGKTHSPETIARMIDTKKKNGTTRKDISYDAYYGEKALEEKAKRAKGVSAAWESMTPEERNTVIEALEIGRDAAAEVAARYHDAMAGYRKHVHDKMDDDVARLDAALDIMRREPVERDANDLSGADYEYE